MKDTDRGENTAELTRRQMLTAGAAASLGGLALGLSATNATAAAPEVPDEWDEEFDVVVVGSGFAGLAAAYEAKKAGASVVVLEKMRTPGGNSIINGGVISAAGSPLQQNAGIEDSPELLLADMLKAGLYLNHAELARIVAEGSLDTVQWTIDELGVQYKPELAQEGGHSVPRMYNTHNQSGSAIVTPQLEKLRELGVTPRTRTRLNHIFRDADGRVKGVQISEGYTFPDADSGMPKTIRAGKAVVLASGGFANDPVFRTIQDPRLVDIESTNQPGATAEALREALRIGCTPVQLSWIQLGPWGSPDERGFGLAPHFAQLCAAMYGIWVDTVTGKRFVNELADRKIRADALLAAGNKCIAMTDAKGFAIGERLLPTELARLLERGVVRRFDTLEELAEAYEAPADALRETLAAFNASVAAGEDREWGRYLQVDQFPLDTAPYYAARLTPKVHHTMGGVRINTRAQALDIENDEPIIGLYAAGEVSGGVHGAVRLGSCAVLDCLIFGRIAGQNAAAEDDWG